jgi:hypothetical protein
MNSPGGEGSLSAGNAVNYQRRQRSSCYAWRVCYRKRRLAPRSVRDAWESGLQTIIVRGVLTACHSVPQTGLALFLD